MSATPALVQSTAKNLMIFLTSSTGHVIGKTGATLTITLSKDGGAFATITPTVTERGSGWYSLALVAGDTDTLGDLVLHITATGADPTDARFVVAVAPATSAAVAAVQADTDDIQARLATIQADTDDIQTRLPAALVGGRIDASVGAMAANVLTATAIAADAITAAKVADGTIDAATFAAGAINAAAIASNAITSAKIATDAVGAAQLAADAVTEIQSGLATSAALATVQADTDDIQTRLPAALVGGRIDASVGAMAANVVTAASIATNAIDADALATDAVTEIQSGLATAAAVAAVQADTDDIQTRLPAALVGGRIDASVGAMAAGVVTAAAVATNAIDADALAADAVAEIQSGLATSAAVAAVQADTDDIQARLPAVLVGGRIDASVGAMAADTLTASALAASAVLEIQSGLALAADLANVQADTDDIQARLVARLDVAVSTRAVPGDAMDLVADAVDASAVAASGAAEIQSGLATAVAVAAVQADTDDIQARLPAALVGGKMDATLSTGERDAMATALLDLASAVDGATVRETFSRMAAALVGKLSVVEGPPGVFLCTFRQQDDAADAVASTCDVDGQRTAVAFP